MHDDLPTSHDYPTLTPERLQCLNNLFHFDRFMTDQELFDLHQKTFKGLDAELRNGMVECIRQAMPTDMIERDKWRDVIKSDPLKWWAIYHHGVGTVVRNRLRKNGFDDARVGMNLDDVWVPVFEAAVLDETFRATLK